jgi:hypothetical protein
VPAPFFPDVTCFADAAAKQTQLALSVMKLFKSGYAPPVGVTIALLTPHEANYDDYAPVTLTAWLAAIRSPSGGAQISSPVAQFKCVADQVVPNTIGGFWIETAAGVLQIVRQFDTPVPMVFANQGLDVNAVIVYPNGQS